MKWTAQEIAAFDRLVDSVSSQNGGERVIGRLDMARFVAEHGKNKCDAMFAHLESGGDKTDFDDEVKP